MASLAEFQQLLKEQKYDQALTDYVIHVDQSLDGTVGQGDVLIGKAFGIQNVAFQFVDPNIINMRAKTEGDSSLKEVWYLPWVSQGSARADLDGTGPSYFSTSQLNGCRFTIQYADEHKKKATVLHLAGNFDRSIGSMKRDELETSELGEMKDTRLRRRYSIGQSPKMPGATKEKGSLQYKILNDQTRMYYGGNKASIFGYREKGGAWLFWAQEMDEKYGRPDIGKGRRNLG
jgi:hypothetical protein